MKNDALAMGLFAFGIALAGLWFLSRTSAGQRVFFTFKTPSCV